MRSNKNSAPRSIEPEQMIKIIDRHIARLKEAREAIISELNERRAAPPVQRVNVVAQPEPEVVAVARDIALTHIKSMRASLKQRGSGPSR